MGAKGGGGDKGIKIQPAKDYEKMIKLQLRYLPKQLQAEYANRAMWDPALTEQAMGFQERYDPRLAQEQYDALLRRDPQAVRAHQLFGDTVTQALQRGYIDPTRAGAYKALGKQVTGDTLRGSTASPAMLRDMTQAILSRSPNLSYGEAQDMATAVYTGQRGQNLQAQRQQATNQFLGQQSESDLALTAGGRYMGTPGLVQMENQIGGVQAPRAFGYVNPNAGLQGVQLGLQNQQAQLYNQSQGGSSNPWTNALGGAATGANYGSIGGPYGAAGGAIVGAAAGAFGYPQYSDQTGKINISRTRLTTPDGIPIVEYDYDGKRWRGVIAQEVQKVRPDAVHHYGNGTLGVFYSKLGIELEEVR
jgi:hypothetical protein